MIKFIVLLFLDFLMLSISVSSQQWTVVPSPNPASNRNILRGVGSISSNDVWAVGESGTQSLIEHWDGSAWTIVSSPSPGFKFQFNL